MARLVEIQAVQAMTAAPVVSPGDLLLFDASGGFVHDGEDVVSLVGVFLRSVVGTNHQVLSPAGSPNAVVFLALRPGRARISLFTGDPWQGSTQVPLDLIVTDAEPGPREKPEAELGGGGEPA